MFPISPSICIYFLFTLLLILYIFDKFFTKITFNSFSKLILFIGLLIKNYPTTNLSKLINKPINKINFENELKVIFEKNLSRMYKINNKVKRN